MKYDVVVGGHAFVVEVEDGLTVDGRAVTGHLHPVPHTPLYHLEMDGRITAVALTRADETWEVQVGGRIWLVNVVDERTRKLRALAGRDRRPGGGSVVKAPMPGMILRLEVEEGQAVTRGAGLVVLEAMKMENEIRAPEDGVVVRIHAEPGRSVEKGTPLVELGPSS